MKTNTLKQKQKKQGILWLFFSLTVIGFSSMQAQVQNNGALYIDNSAAFFVKGDFAYGTGSTTQTERDAATFGKLVFGSVATASSAASGAAKFTDGYASTLSTNFVLPIGQSNVYAPVTIQNAAVTNGVHAAYVRAAPTNASNLDASVLALSGAEHWIIKGDNATITLSWSVASALGSTTNVTNLTVAGYNNTTSEWEAIASGTPTGNITAGTITTSAAVTLGSYTAFTLAKKGFTCAAVFAATGTTKTWNNGWSPNAPTEIDNAVIEGSGSPGSFTCNSLAVNANITLIDGQTIEVVNGITGTGVITMSTEASILQRNNASTIAAPIALTKSTRSGMKALDYIYWGSPLVTTALTVLDAAKAPSGVANAFEAKYKYVSGTLTAAGGWQPLDVISPGKGFIMRIKQQAPFATLNATVNEQINLTFSGTANNGLVTIPVLRTTSETSARNKYLLANPYPSAIDADKFLLENTNVDGVIYIWKAQTGFLGGNTSYVPADYIARTRAGSTKFGVGGNVEFGGIIATGQGFKVTALGPGNVTFNNCMRVSGNNNQFLRTANEPIIDRYKLNLTGINGEGSQMLVAYTPETSLAYDRMYDAEILSVNGTQLYSILDNTTRKLTINARPSFETTDVVNVGVSKTSTAPENFSIAIADKEGLFASDAVIVYLYDSALNNYHNLANGAYTFNTLTTEMNNRFQVVYQNAALNNADFESNAVTAAIANETLNIVASLPIVNIMIYDISGRLVTEIKGNNQTNVLNAFRFSEGIYIAKIKMNNGATATRKLINKI